LSRKDFFDLAEFVTYLCSDPSKEMAMLRQGHVLALLLLTLLHWGTETDNPVRLLARSVPVPPHRSILPVSFRYRADFDRQIDLSREMVCDVPPLPPTRTSETPSVVEGQSLIPSTKPDLLYLLMSLQL
jgi:hypothetical protein